MNWRSALQESRMQARSALHISGNQWASHLTKCCIPDDHMVAY